MVGIYKAYDIRGLYEKQITIKTAYDLGYAYAKLYKPKTIVIAQLDLQ
ncbi:MAG: phosphomannomutase [Candidatus Woesearchaeota archaeon]|jgi:phosphomannomutase